MDDVGEEIDLKLAIGDTREMSVAYSLAALSVRLVDELDDLISQYAKEVRNHG